MSPQRMLQPQIADSESLHNCSPAAFLAFPHFLLEADDYGRFFADPGHLAFSRFANRFSAADVAQWLADYERTDMIRMYKVRGRLCAEFHNFHEYQTIRWVKSATTPGPDGITPRFNGELSKDERKTFFKDIPRVERPTSLGQELLSKYCGSSAEVIPKYCGSSAEVLLQQCNAMQGNTSKKHPPPVQTDLPYPDDWDNYEREICNEMLLTFRNTFRDESPDIALRWWDAYDHDNVMEAVFAASDLRFTSTDSVQQLLDSEDTMTAITSAREAARKALYAEIALDRESRSRGRD